MGQGPHAGGAEDPAQYFACQAALAGQAGSVSASYSEYFLSADAGDVGADAASHDRAVLHGRLSDGVYRPAPDHRVVLVDLGVLHHRVPRVVPETLEALDVSFADADGRRRRADRGQHTRRNGGVAWYTERFCPYAQVCD